MKTKLLKKIRKRYTIVYYPKEYIRWDKKYKGECMVLYDKQETYRTLVVDIIKIDDPKVYNYNMLSNHFVRNKEDAKNYLIFKLTDWIISDYKHTRTRNNRQGEELIWYNK